MIHKMYKIQGFKPREYQTNISNNSKNNTLICLPTGTGKTKIAILLLVERLNQFPDSKVLIMSPTKPLSSQISEEVKECTNISPAQITLLTGAIKPAERKKLFSTSKIIVGTPQTFQKDLENNRITLENTSLLVIDECHRSKQRFANTIVAKNYKQKATNQKIIALTASPGSTKEKISEVCNNLFIENIEIRTEEDIDLAKHIQKKTLETIKVELPEEFQKIRHNLKEYYKTKIPMLKKYGITKPASIINKTDLIMLQRRLQVEINKRNRTAYSGISLVAELLKISYTLELIETQTPTSLLNYFKKLKKETSKAAKKIINNEKVKQAIKLTETLSKNNTLHPKMEKLKELIKENPQNKTIIFANYRSTVAEIKEEIEKIQNIKPVILIGQKEGVTQKEQLKTIENFNKNIYNTLICTSIGEEGLSIGSLDQAIFYDHTGSEIRKIQRSGRVARIKAGRIINLVTKGTRDEALLWTGDRKEKKMHNLLHYMKKNMKNENLS